MTTGMSPSRGLKALGVTALLGSDRAGREGETPAGMLARAAVAGMRSRAGRRCRADGQLIEACPADKRAAATASQSAILDRLLASPDAAMIHEWCVLAGARGVRAVAASVPILLEWWSRQSARSPEVFDATGACGVWLARLNPQWRRPVAGVEIPGNADDIWQTGTSAERSALLLTVRKADPRRAMLMVKGTWEAEGAEERRRFIEVMGHAVSKEDEAFLEMALDDRSKTVRREAARVLTRLAGSALRGRMRDRAAGMILAEKVKAGLLGRSKVKVRIEPPKEFDKSWERDGLEEQPASGKGKRAFWMVQVISSMDLAAWGAPCGLEPGEFIRAIGEEEYFDEVFSGMLASVAGCPEQPEAAAWSDAIIAVCAERAFTGEAQLASLWSAQSVERSEGMRLKIVTGKKAPAGTAVWRMLTSDARGWSLDFSARALRVLGEATPKKPDAWEFHSSIELVSRLLHPAAADMFEGLLGQMYPDGPSEGVCKSLDRVRLRAEMHREFQP